MKTLTVLSYNIHKGLSTSGLRNVLPEMRDAIRALGADLVLLQEVLGSAAQFEYLADQVWTHFSYGQNSSYDGGHHGNAILSKYPIIHSKNTDVSAHRFEKRGILLSRIHAINFEQTIDCYCLHFGLFRRGRDKQLTKLCQKVSAHSEKESPLIVAGDFNDWGENACSILETNLGVKDVCLAANSKRGKSFPSKLPLLALDRIYVRGFQVISANVISGLPWTRLSDHSPILTKLSLKS